MNNLVVNSYTLYNKSIGIVDTGDSMYGFGRLETSTAYSILIPDKVVDDPLANPPVEANDNVGATISTITSVNTVRLTVSAPMLYSDNGAKGAKVKVEVFYRLTNGDHDYANPNWTQYIPYPENAGWNEIDSAKPTRSETAISIEVILPTTDYYDIKVVRSTTSKSDTSDISRADTIYLKEINEISYEDLSYPCVALLGIRAKATDQLSGSMPTITSVVKGIKVKVPTGYSSTYDPIRKVGVRKQTTEWDGTLAATKVWTDNPVWCLYDFLTNERYGLGKDFKILESRRNLMLANFFAMAQYCDEYIDEAGIVRDADDVTARPRFSLNLVIDQQKSAREWINTICASMRATLYYCEGIVLLDIDRPKSITQLFTMSSIKDFTQSSISFKSLPNIYHVQFPNIEKDYETDSFTLESKAYQDNINPNPVIQNLDLVGIVHEKEARSLASYALNKTSTSITSVSFKTGTNALNSSVLDVVGIQHDVPMWGAGGHIENVEGNVIHLSSEFQYALAAGTSGALYGELSLQVSNGGAPVKLEVVSPTLAGTYSSVTVIPEEGFTPAVGDQFVLNFTDFSVKPFKIVSLRRDVEELMEVTAVEYNSSIYNDYLLDLGENNTDDFTSITVPQKTSVTNVVASSREYVDSSGSIKIGVDVTYTVPNNINWAGVKVAYGKNGIYSYTEVDRTGTIFIPNILEEGNYRFIAISTWKDGTQQSINECLEDDVNQPYYDLTITLNVGNTDFTTSGVTGLYVEGTLGGAYFGKTCKVIWNVPTVTNYTGNLIANDATGAHAINRSLINYYKVDVKNTNGTLRRTARSYTESYEYSYELNREDGSPTRTFDITVTAIDKLGRESAAATLRCSNPVPAAIT